MLTLTLTLRIKIGFTFLVLGSPGQNPETRKMVVVVLVVGELLLLYNRFTAPLTAFGTTLVSQYQKFKNGKVKPVDLLGQEIVSGNGISWASPQTDNHVSIPPLRVSIL